MKKRIGILLAFVILLVSATAYADFVNPAIIDTAGVLTEQEISALETELEAVRDKYDVDVAVYMEDSMMGYTAQDTADDIFDYGGYGGGEGKDGIILYITLDEREYHFSTHGSAMTIFNDNGLAYLENQVVPYLSDGEYYNAFSTYAQKCDELLEMASNGTPYNKKQRTEKYIFTVIIAALLLPLLIAYIRMHGQLAKMKTAVSQKYAENYVKPGSFKLDNSRDIFMYSVVSKREKPKSSSGSHTSSSGESHGGRGGSF